LGFLSFFCKKTTALVITAAFLRWQDLRLGASCGSGQIYFI